MIYELYVRKQQVVRYTDKKTESQGTMTKVGWVIIR